MAKRRGYGRYLKVYDGGKAEVNWRKVRQDARYDRKFVRALPGRDRSSI